MPRVLAMAALLLATPAFATPAPVITAISAINTSKLQAITITGSGFGRHKAYKKKDVTVLAFADDTASWQAGYSPAGDKITLSVAKWIDTQIVISGFAGRFGRPPNVLSSGDTIRIEVWNAQSKGLGASSICASSVGGGAVTCP